MKIFDKKFVLIMTVVLGIWAIVSFALPGTFIDNMQGSETYGQKNPYIIYGLLAFILITLPAIYAAIRIVIIRINAQEEFVELSGGLILERLGEEESSLPPKRSKREVLALFMAEVKLKLSVAPTGKKAFLFLLIALWLIYNLLCIFIVPNKEISAWWLAFISDNPFLWLFKSVGVWAIMLVFGAFAIGLAANHIIGIDEKFGTVEIWLLIWVVMVLIITRLLIINWVATLAALVFIFFVAVLPILLIFRALEKRGRRLPGGFDIAD